MKKEFKMSFFLPPISPVKDADGKTVKAATLTPCKEMTLKEVWKLITASPRLRELTEAVRAAAQSGDKKAYRSLKQETLPYVTPCGTFSYRRSDRLTAASGLTVVDIDGLDSYREAVDLRHQLFDNPFLRPSLVFVSPSGRGVKAFVPYDLNRLADVKQNAAENVYWLMNYVQSVYGTPEEAGKKDKGVDRSGKDLVRACFLSHDADALLREPEEDGARKEPEEDGAPKEPKENGAPKETEEDGAPKEPEENGAPKEPGNDALSSTVGADPCVRPKA